MGHWSNYGRNHYLQNVGAYASKKSLSSYYAKGNIRFERLSDGRWLWWMTYSGEKTRGFYRGSAKEVYKFVGGRLRASGGRLALSESEIGA